MPFDEQSRTHFQQFQLTSAHIASHPRFPELVEELEESGDAYENAKVDPKKYFQSKGFELPDEATVTVSHESPLTFTVCVNSWCLSYTVSLEVTHA
jgi:hypothetical protein